MTGAGPGEPNGTPDLRCAMPAAIWLMPEEA